MIPASYLYKSVMSEAWGDPANAQAEPVVSEPRGPSKGHLAGLVRLLASALRHEAGRPRRPANIHA